MLGDLPMVGRAGELAILRHLFERSCTGHPQVVILLGEAGGGKTRLAAEFLAWAHTQSADVLTGRAFAAEGSLPYAPLAEALRPCLERENAPEDLLGDPWLVELARLLPELRDRYPDLSDTAPDPQLAHARMLEAVTRLGLALATRRPVVLFLDDMQWTDAATRDVLQYAVRRWAEAGSRTLTVLALRLEDLGTEWELARWLGNLERAAPVTRTQLRPLAADDVVQMVELLADSAETEAAESRTELMRAFGQWLALHTYGNPATLIRQLDALLATKAVALHRRPAGTWALDVASVPQLPAAVGRQQHLDWGDAPDTAEFHGRARERASLSQWVLNEQCRLVAIIGIAGVGKTALAARFGRDVAGDFDIVFWRSLRNVPPVEEWLTDAIEALAALPGSLPAGVNARVALLVRLLRERRCLLFLDNVETVLAPGVREGRYRDEYAGYGQLLQEVGETAHRSCLVLTSRELPPEVGRQEGVQGAVHVLRLAGLGTDDSRVILRQRGLVGDDLAWQALVQHMGGNALALKMACETVAELYGGDIAAFIRDMTEPSGSVFAGIRLLLQSQLERLSELERALLYWLAIEREPTGLAQLWAELEPAVPRGDILEALDALRRRSLIERGPRGATFTLQPVILEYATDLLVTTVAGEIERGEPRLLLTHAILQATGKDYVRRSQERLIAAPLLERLVAASGSAAEAGRRLLDLLAHWRLQVPAEHSYGPGNVVNLVRLLRGDLRGVDVAGLAVRQAYLQEVDAQDVNLAGARLTESVLAEAFYYPTSVALSADGAYLAAGTSHGDVRVWRLADRTPVLAVQGHDSGVYGVAIGVDGRVVASVASMGRSSCGKSQPAESWLSSRDTGDHSGAWP
jgi:hypothetical protein